jgi:uncharacterized membrane protein YfcA
LQDIWPLVGITVLGGLIQGTAGFGFGLFSMGILVTLMPVPQAVMLVSIMSLASTLTNFVSLRQEMNWREALPIVVVALPATALGVGLLRWLDPAILRLGVAGMILAGCAVSLWSPGRPIIRKPLPWAPLSGLVGGIFGGALSMGGPPVVLYTLLRGWEKTTTKGVMVAYFVFTGFARVGMHVAAGLLTPEVGRQTLFVVIPGLAASYLGTRVFRRMSSRAFRYAVTALLVFLAVRILAT